MGPRVPDVRLSLSRRRLLTVGLGGGALLAFAGATGLYVWPTRLRTPARPLQVLSQAEFSVLAAIAERTAPAREAFPGALELEVPEDVDAVLAMLHPADQADFKNALWLFENALVGLILDQRLGPFSAASAATRDAVLEAARTSSIGVRRQAFQAITGLCGAAYYANPAVAPALGYPGPPNYGQTALSDADVAWDRDAYRPPGWQPEIVDPPAPEGAQPPEPTP